MKVIFVCASVDLSNPIIGDTLDRAQTMAQHPDISNLIICSLRGSGKWSMRGIDVHGIGTNKKSRIISLFFFWYKLYSLIKSNKPDVIYLYMTPTLAPIVSILKIFFNFRIVTWFGHSIYTKLTKISLLYFTDVWLNSNRSMAPFKANHLKLIGQGVMPGQFFYNPKAQKKYDLVTVGRITRVKKIEEMFDVLIYCRNNFDKKYTLNICGDSFVEADLIYKQELEKKVIDLKLNDQVFFSGMISRENLPTLIQQSRVFLFLVDGGVGKASLEALACGIPVVVSSPNADDFFGTELSTWFLTKPDTESVANCLFKILNLAQDEYDQLSQKSYDLFKNNYTMEKFIDKAVQNMKLR